MNDLTFDKSYIALDPATFGDPDTTVRLYARASVPLQNPYPLLFNTR